MSQGFKSGQGIFRAGVHIASVVPEKYLCVLHLFFVSAQRIQEKRLSGAACVPAREQPQGVCRVPTCNSCRV